MFTDLVIWKGFDVIVITKISILEELRLFLLREVFSRYNKNQVMIVHEHNMVCGSLVQKLKEKFMVSNIQRAILNQI